MLTSMTDSNGFWSGGDGSKRPTMSTKICLMSIRGKHQSVTQSKGNTMGQEGITFHFTKTNASPLFTSFYWLTCQIVDCSSSPHLILVGNHMTETLVVHHPKVNVSMKRFTTYARIHGFTAMVMVPGSKQLGTKIIHGRGFTCTECKRGCIVSQTMKCTRLTRHGFDQHPNGHT